MDPNISKIIHTLFDLKRITMTMVHNNVCESMRIIFFHRSNKYINFHSSISENEKEAKGNTPYTKKNII